MSCQKPLIDFVLLVFYQLLLKDFVGVLSALVDFVSGYSTTTNRQVCVLSVTTDRFCRCAIKNFL